MVDPYSHIKTEEIEKDIQDTEREIEFYKNKIAGCRIMGDRMSLYRADSYEREVNEREVFIRKLRIILNERKKNGEEQN